MPESEDPKNDLRNSQFGGGFINAQNVNAQRIGGDIWNFFFGQQLAPVKYGYMLNERRKQVLSAADIMLQLIIKIAPLDKSLSL